MAGLARVCLLWVVPLALADILRNDAYLSLEWMDCNPAWTAPGVSGYRAFLLWYGKANIGMEEAFHSSFSTNGFDLYNFSADGLTKSGGEARDDVRVGQLRRLDRKRA